MHSSLRFLVLVSFLPFACAEPVGDDADGGLGGAGPTTGGASSTGGTGSGGLVGTGGAGSGGAATGGASTGGAATGGASTGGAATGGASTGGAATGGASTGGAATGGASTGGSSGTCTAPAWTAKNYPSPGTKVSKNGNEYESCFYANASDDPATATQTACTGAGAWKLNGPC